MQGLEKSTHRRTMSRRDWLASITMMSLMVLGCGYFLVNSTITLSTGQMSWLIHYGWLVPIVGAIAILILAVCAAWIGYEWLLGIYYLHNHEPGDGRVRILKHWGMGKLNRGPRSGT